MKTLEYIEEIKKKLSINPNDIALLHDYALLECQTGNFNSGIELLERAIKLCPSEASLYNNLGKAYRASGNLDKAIHSFKEALKQRKNYALAHNNLGACFYQKKLIREAIEHFLKAIRIEPDYFDPHYNLANCYVQISKPHDALAHYEKVFQLNPEHVNTIHNLGILLTNLGKYKEAVIYLNKALNYTPDNLDLKFHLAIILDSTGKPENAKDYYKEIIQHDNKYAMAHHNLATVYLREQDIDKAKEHYKVAFLLDNENKTAEHMLNALNNNTTNSAPSEYVKLLFNQYASNYDEHLKGQLEYKVPEKLRTLLAGNLDKLPQHCTTLDLGCGTGQCAVYFRDISNKLIGVDIADKMLAIAKENNFYDKLHNSEIVSFLSKEENKNYDLIIAADVFVYIGCLKETFKQIKSCLNKNGCFLFSVEQETDKHNKNEEGYSLSISGRYKHSKDYILNLAKENNLTVAQRLDTVIRTQDNKPVDGILFLLSNNN